ncbi:MAG: glk [Acidimicrobiia bacterium]|nr:glk [Acidimicrobiia bacterium]
MFIGVDIGGTKCLAVALDEHGQVRGQARIPTPRSPAALVAEVLDLVRSLGPMTALGLGVAGLVDRRGVLRLGPNLHGIGQMNVAEPFRETLGVPVAVANDATCGMMAEWRRGAAVGLHDALYVGFGTGVAGAQVCGGVLQLGHHGFAGEFGHMIVDVTGPQCVCGQRGCWERYASGAGLALFGERYLGEPLRGEEVVSRARTGDAAAIRAIDEVARWAAVGLVNLVNAFDPEVVIVAGGLVEIGPLLLEPMRGWFAELTMAGAMGPLPELRPAVFGETSSAVGAALLAGELLQSPDGPTDDPR